MTTTRSQWQTSCTYFETYWNLYHMESIVHLLNNWMKVAYLYCFTDDISISEVFLDAYYRGRLRKLKICADTALNFWIQHYETWTKTQEKHRKQEYYGNGAYQYYNNDVHGIHFLQTQLESFLTGSQRSTCLRTVHIVTSFKIFVMLNYTYARQG